MAQLLVIEDEVSLAKNLVRYFERQGHVVEAVHDGPRGVAAARRLQPDVVILDFQLPGMDGLDVIHHLRQHDPQVRIIMISGHASIALAVDAMKAGSFDLLTKPVVLADLQAVVARALEQLHAQRALDFYQRRAADESSLDSLWGESPGMVALRELVRTIARTEPADQSVMPPVLVTGETGTGKELVARACHFAGPRAQAPFVEVNCAALPAHLIEGELFGHEKGAFTDAHARRIGLIEAADNGTLFLDEIGELDQALQAKLLRVLEDLRVRRIGAVQDRRVNVRVIAATNRDLGELVRLGRFRSDLLYRLCVVQVNIPPLRQRGGDVLLLAQRFMAQFAHRYGKAVPQLDAGAAARLRHYDWPGNVRELRNAMERAVMLGQGPTLQAADVLPGFQAPTQGSGGLAAPLPAPALGNASAPPSLAELERQALVQALARSGGNVTRAARLLGVSRDTLRYRMEKYQLQRG